MSWKNPGRFTENMVLEIDLKGKFHLTIGDRLRIFSNTEKWRA
jgi:hypothetical protein